MAEIPIQRKARRNVWPIVILLLIVAAAVAWYLWSRSTTTTDTTATPRPATSLLATPVIHVAQWAPHAIRLEV